jgi:hypothetical protein
MVVAAPLVAAHIASASADGSTMATTTPTSPSRSSTKTKKQAWESRAVTRLVEPGNWAECALCEEVIKFRARERRTHVICNVYVDNSWDRVEHFHSDCYKAADEPYGEALE